MVRMRIGSIGLAGATLTVACIALLPAAADAKGKNNQEHNARGKVVSVTTAPDGSGSITISMHKHKKQNGGAPAAKAEVITKSFQLGPNTRYATIGQMGTMPATPAAIRQGEHVVIKATNGPADEVDIVPHTPHKHKKKAAVGAAN
jgi:hypothetical protein